MYFDTSFLIYALCYKIDFVGEIAEKFGRMQIVVPSTVLNELAAVRRRKKFAAAALLAEKFLKEGIKSGNVQVIRTREKVDVFILKSARPGDIVCTNDKELRKSLKKRGIKTAITKGKRIFDR